MNKELNDKLNEIILYIKETDSYKNYLKAKEKLNERQDLKIIIDNIKKLQQELVKNPKAKDNINKQLNDNLKILESDITYMEYTMYLNEVNNMLAIFENKLNKYFEDVFN